MLTCWNLLRQKLSGSKNFKTAAKIVRRYTLRKQLGSGSRKGTASRVIPTKPAKRTSRLRWDILRQFYKHFSLFMSSTFRYQTFVAVFGNLAEKVPVADIVLSFYEPDIYPVTLLNENCIEFEFQTNGNYYVDLRHTYLALKLKFVKTHGYETYKTKEVKKTQRKSKSRGANGGGGGERRSSSSSRYSCEQHFALNFFQCWCVHQQSANLQQ